MSRNTLGGLSQFLFPFGYRPDLLGVIDVIDEQNSITVVSLVLEDARKPAVRPDSNGLAAQVHALDCDTLVSRDLSNETRNGEAALNVVLHLT